MRSILYIIILYRDYFNFAVCIIDLFVDFRKWPI